MNDDIKVDPAEAGSAQELAEALEGQGDGELSRDRSQAVLQRILAEAGPALDRRAKRPLWRRWALPVGGFGLASATAAALLLFWPAAPVTLPAPDPALLKAQAQAASAQVDASALRRGMRDYRGRMLAALDRRYGGGS